MGIGVLSTIDFMNPYSTNDKLLSTIYDIYLRDVNVARLIFEYERFFKDKFDFFSDNSTRYNYRNYCKYSEGIWRYKEDGNTVILGSSNKISYTHIYELSKDLINADGDNNSLLCDDITPFNISFYVYEACKKDDGSYYIPYALIDGFDKFEINGFEYFHKERIKSLKDLEDLCCNKCVKRLLEPAIAHFVKKHDSDVNLLTSLVTRSLI